MPSYYCACPEDRGSVVKNSNWRAAVLAVGGCAVSALVVYAPGPVSTLYASGTLSRGLTLQPVVTYAPTSSNFGLVIQPQEVPVAQPALYSAPQAHQHTLRLATVASGMLMLFAATVTLVHQFFRGNANKFVALASMAGEAMEEGHLRNPTDVNAKAGTPLGEKSFAISRRGMAPVLGIMLSPSLGIRPAMAGDAPVGPAGSVVISDPKGWIAENLPGSLSSKEFVRLTADILVRQGIEPENTVACVGVCRDELCQPLVDEIEGEWGDAFNMTSLAGMLTLGKTGLKAAMAHSPVDKDGRERYFFLAFPHIAVDTAGVGKCTRPGRNKTSSACGALVAFTNELKGGKPSMEYDPLDPEYSFMKTALMGLIPAGTAPDLLEVTKTAAEASLSQIEDLIAATVDPSKADYAVCTGVLVHQQDLRGRDAKVVGPSRQYVDQVWPTAFYVVKNGRKKDLIWRLERD